TAEAQRAEKIHRIGYVSPQSRGERNEAFVQALQKLGYVEGRNVHIEMRFAEGSPERLPNLVEEVIRRGIDVLVVSSTIGARAAKNATSTIPIVFAGSSDPVLAGIVTNLAHPDGNLTGTSLALSDGFAEKYLELLKEAAPKIGHFAVLWSSSNPAAARFVRDLQSAARTLGARVDVHHASNPVELDAALAAISGSGARGLVVTPSPFAVTSQDKLIRFAASRRLPAMYFAENFPDAGGLMAYGPSLVDAHRRAATYVDRILKGAKPGELPVEQPTKFNLIVNLKTANALGLKIPQAVLLRVDRVIE
ncbi:MAG: ABC transporter substrate-binding protein, partial [Pseudomonadota bacterium]